MEPSETLLLTIRTRQQVVYQGTVAAVSGLNEKGPFDILPQHGNFISLVSQTLRIHDVRGPVRDMQIGSGVLHVAQNKVTVYLGFKK